MKTVHDDKYICKKCGSFIEAEDFTVNIVKGKEVVLQMKCNKCGFESYTFIDIDEMTIDDDQPLTGGRNDTEIQSME